MQGFLNPLNIMIQRHLPILNSLYLGQRKMMLKGIPDEITRLLEHEKKLIQLYHENQQNSQLGVRGLCARSEDWGTPGGVC